MRFLLERKSAANSNHMFTCQSNQLNTGSNKGPSGSEGKAVANGPEGEEREWRAGGGGGWERRGGGGGMGTERRGREGEGRGGEGLGLGCISIT